MESIERIICAAIYIDDGNQHYHQPNNISKGFVIAGYRHSNCYATLKLLGVKFEKVVEGFLTSCNNFANRFAAAMIANEAEQTSNKTELYSEDLY